MPFFTHERVLIRRTPTPFIPQTRFGPWTCRIIVSSMLMIRWRGYFFINEWSVRRKYRSYRRMRFVMDGRWARRGRWDDNPFLFAKLNNHPFDTLNLYLSQSKINEWMNEWMNKWLKQASWFTYELPYEEGGRASSDTPFERTLLHVCCAGFDTERFHSPLYHTVRVLPTCSINKNSQLMEQQGMIT